jgi:uncharacterized YigZ family protein
VIFSYTTIQGSSEGVFKEKGSKFLAFAYPVKNEEEVKFHLHSLRKEYFDATHHCYAYVLGRDKKIFRAVDDGEPSHSAGTPILNQIKSHQLTNILVAVVRYFGGTKLGVGGLVQAYKSATEEALKNVIIIETEITSTLQLHFEYEIQPDVMKLVKEFDLKVLQQNYSLHCELEVECRLRVENNVLDRLNLWTSMRYPIKWKVLERG